MTVSKVLVVVNPNFEVVVIILNSNNNIHQHDDDGSFDMG
jgi:hypothetical protein